MHFLVMLLGIAGGIAVGSQAAVNTALSRNIGAVETALVSFLVGGTCLAVLTFALGRGNFAAVTSAPWWQLLGGVLGAFYVFVLITAVPQIGVAATISTVIAGQILAGLVIDHFGLLGVTATPITFTRAGSVVLMAGALMLFFRK